MKYLFFHVFSFFFLVANSQNATPRITGKVTQNDTPIYNASVNLKDTARGVNTNDKGEYSINGKPGEILVFSHIGLKTIEVVLEDVTTKLNIKMVREEVQLDEVVVKKNKRKKAIEREIQFDGNRNLIRTQHGILDARRSGLSIQMFEGEDLFQGSTTFIEAIRGKLNCRITYPKGSIFVPVVYLRETTSLLKGHQPAIYDLDGVVMEGAPTSIPVTEIDRIAVIRGIGASGRYGRRGHGGVIVINTKRGKYKNPKLTQKFKDSIRLRKKRAIEAFKTVSWDSEIPVGLKNLFDSDSEEKALQVFEEYKENFGNSPYDAITVGNYFISEWKNKKKAEDIWKSVKTTFFNNAVVLKALAYSYEESKDPVAAMQLYQAIALLRSNYAQSYRDLANINAELGNHKKALNLYARQLLDRADAPQSAMDSIINIESHNLIVLNKMELSSQVIDIEQALGYSPIRLLLEWNNGEAEFDLQCMNPPNYYTWRHSFERSPESIEDEKIHGYSSKQFFINESLGGKWRFNLKYFGNKSFEPTYLKVTVYFNYGKPFQRKELKVYRLQKENVNRHLLTIDTDLKSISS